MIGIWSIIFQFKTEMVDLFPSAAKNPPGCESEDDAVKTVPGGSLRTLSVHEVKQQARLQLYVPFYLTLLLPLAL